MHVVVATHGHCFDGLASAVTFTRLLRHLRTTPLEFEYRACGYGNGQLHPEGILTGEENAILDYRFSQTPGLTWYFDHHRTGLPGATDREAFSRIEESGQGFFSPDYSSCTKLIADTARSRFGVELELDPLVSWADRIDTASFGSADEAISRADPVQRLAAVIENQGGDGLLNWLVPRLLELTLAEVAALPEIQERYRPIASKRERFIKRVQDVAVTVGRVVFVDLTKGQPEGLEKFVTYALYPKSVYSVIVGRTRNDVHISIGYNPWSGVLLDTDISAICARHGGGGHAVVGAISLPGAEVERARTLARQIAEDLG
jgi:hypothetical protein